MLATHGAALRRIARVYAGVDGEENDLHQEILLQLWRGLASFRGDAAPGTWLYRVALNTALTWRRHVTRRTSDSSARHDLPVASASGHRNEAAILEEYLGTLGAMDRSVILLYMEGLSYQQIAEVTGLSAGAAGVRLHRMKQTFSRRYLED